MQKHPLAMPEFGQQHSDEIVALAAFVSVLPEISADAYATLTSSAPEPAEQTQSPAAGDTSGEPRAEAPTEWFAQSGAGDMSYVRFGLMILTSTVAMFVLMYLNTYAWEHLFFSETRTYMAILMGAVMAVIMLAYMLGMYSKTQVNMPIFVGAVVVFALSLWLVGARSPSAGRATCGR